MQDDGEPSNSAGPPILGVIRANDLTKVLFAVARYFGGTKLGVGGLIEAYREGAAEALRHGKVVQRIRTERIQVAFAYEHMGTIMGLVKRLGLQPATTDFSMACSWSWTFACRPCPKQFVRLKKPVRPRDPITRGLVGSTRASLRRGRSGGTSIRPTGPPRPPLPLRNLLRPAWGSPRGHKATWSAAIQALPLHGVRHVGILGRVVALVVDGHLKHRPTTRLQDANEFGHDPVVRHVLQQMVGHQRIEGIVLKRDVGSQSGGPPKGCSSPPSRTPSGSCLEAMHEAYSGEMQSAWGMKKDVLAQEHPNGPVPFQTQGMGRGRFPVTSPFRKAQLADDFYDGILEGRSRVGPGNRIEGPCAPRCNVVLGTHRVNKLTMPMPQK